MHDVGAVRIQHAFWVAGGAGGVAHRRCGIFVEGLPFEIAIDLTDPVLIGDRVLQRRLRHMRLVGEHDVALDAGQLVGDLFQDRHEGDVGHHHAILRMVDDPGDLLGKQPWIDGMADRADPHDAVPCFEMAPGIPGDGGHAIAELDAVAFQPLRDLQRALVDFSIIGAMDGTFDRPCNDFLLAMDGRRVLENSVTQQRPVLHQSQHRDIPPECSIAFRGSSARLDAKSSARKRRRKWASRRGRGRRTAMVTMAVLLFVCCGQTHFADAKVKVPLPRSRPAEAPSAAVEPSATPEVKNAEPPAAPAPALSACRLGLTETIAIAPSIPDIHGPGGCGGEDLVRLEAVVLPDRRQVAVTPAAILRCKMASAIADWVRTDIATLAKGLGGSIAGLDNFDSFECRGRNRIVGAQLSEHGRANALDVRSFKFADGRTISLTDRTVARDVRETVLHAVRAVLNGARARLRRLSRRSHPSRSDGAAQRLPDLPVECMGPIAGRGADAAGPAPGGGAAACGCRRTGSAAERR